MQDKPCSYCGSFQDSNAQFCSQCSNPLGGKSGWLAKNQNTIIITALATTCAFLIAVMIGFSGRSNTGFEVDLPAKTPIANTSTSSEDLKIKGNKKSKIYHLPGCPNYNDIADRNVIWFKTHEEAKSRGFRMAKNCD